MINENVNLTKFRDSFYVRIDFDNGEVKYLDPHGYVKEECHKTSLIACYKSLVRFLGKRRKFQHCVLEHRKEGDDEAVNRDNFERLGLITIVMEDLVLGNLEEKKVKAYWLFRIKNPLFGTEEDADND